VMAWSEMSFTACVLLFLLFLRRYSLKEDLASLVGLIVFSACASMTRYIGVVTFLFGVLFLLEHRWLHPRHFKCFFFLAPAPLAIWVLRNLVLCHHMFGMRGLSEFSVLHNVLELPAAVAYSLYPMSWILGGSPVFSVAIVVLFSVVCIWLLWGLIQESKALWLLCFVVVYTLSILVCTSAISIDHTNFRLMFPVWPAVVVLLSLSVDSRMKGVRGR